MALVNPFLEKTEVYLYASRSTYDLIKKMYASDLETNINVRYRGESSNVTKLKLTLEQNPIIYIGVEVRCTVEDGTIYQRVGWVRVETLNTDPNYHISIDELKGDFYEVENPFNSTSDMTQLLIDNLFALSSSTCRQCKFNCYLSQDLLDLVDFYNQLQQALHNNQYQYEVEKYNPLNTSCISLLNDDLWDYLYQIQSIPLDNVIHSWNTFIVGNNDLFVNLLSLFVITGDSNILTVRNNLSTQLGSKVVDVEILI